MGVPSPANYIERLGERRELPQWGPGQSPGRKLIFCIGSILDHRTLLVEGKIIFSKFNSMNYSSIKQ